MKRPRRVGPASLKTWGPTPPGVSGEGPGLAVELAPSHRAPEPSPGCEQGWPSVQDGLKVRGQGRVGCCLQGGQSGPGEPPAQSGSGCKAVTEVRPPHPPPTPRRNQRPPFPRARGTAETSRHLHCQAPVCRRAWGGHLRREQAPHPCRGHGGCQAEARRGAGSGVRGRTRRWGAAGETEDEDPRGGREAARPGGHARPLDERGGL